MSRPAHQRRRLLVPEVVQTSAMDCGPAALEALLAGFGIEASYERLREACQTGVDGTSIDTLEALAVHLGLEAEQTMFPADHLLLPQARLLPALVVVRHSAGVTHFVIAWSCHGGLLQIMDPATGRRWCNARRFLDSLYVHTQRVQGALWREWAGTGEFLAPLRARLEALRLDGHSAQGLLSRAQEDEGWVSLAALDAGVRMVDVLVRSGSVAPGREAGRLLGSLLEEPTRSIPAPYWLVHPDPEYGAEGMVLLRGATAIRILGRQARRPEPSGARGASAQTGPSSPEVEAVLEVPPRRPVRELFSLLRADGWSALAVPAACIVLSAAGMLVEAVLFRGLVDLGRNLKVVEQRVGALGAIIVLSAALLALELSATLRLQRLGRGLETRLRVAFLSKVPRLPDRYFSSRPVSDMAQRSHESYRLRILPELGGRMLHVMAGLVLTTAGLVWLFPPGAPLVLVLATLTLGLPLVARPFLSERDMRMRTHSGAISRFYLDALLGLMPIRAHGAERAVRLEHEALLVEWARASRDVLRGALWLQGLQALTGFGLAAALLLRFLGETGDVGGALLVAYWALTLPVLGQQLALLWEQWPQHRNVTLRLLEPLTVAEEPPVPTASAAPALPGATSSGVAVRFEGVRVQAGGHTLLEGVELSIDPGEHVAVVGRSGAGKSTLLGVLLGWHRPAAGQVLVDGHPLQGEAWVRYRESLAWVDPAVHLWNRPLLENLCYGAPEPAAVPIGQLLSRAELHSLLETLPKGFQTPLGEGGALVSGGEGQRVRLARALSRSRVRLALLDEPFRGLDRERRHGLLARVSQLWREATLLCVTHDIDETLGFDRVLVVEGGRIVEQGSPKQLASTPDSRYRELLEAERVVRRELWQGSSWRRLWVAGGRVMEARGSGGGGISLMALD